MRAVEFLPFAMPEIGEEEIAELGAMVKKLIEEPVSPMSASESSEKN